MTCIIEAYTICRRLELWVAIHLTGKAWLPEGRQLVASAHSVLEITLSKLKVLLHITCAWGATMVVGGLHP